MEIKVNTCNGISAFLKSHQMSIHDRKNGIILIKTDPLDTIADDNIATVVSTLIMINPTLRVSTLSILPNTCESITGISGAIVIFEPKA